MARPGGGGQGRWLGAALLLGLLAAPAAAAAGAAAGTVTLSEEHGYTAGWAVKGTRVEVTLTKAWTADSGLWLGFGLAENTSGKWSMIRSLFRTNQRSNADTTSITITTYMK